MGAGASSNGAVDNPRPLERRLSTVSATPSATVVTSTAATPTKKALACTVLSVNSNSRIGFLSSVKGDDRFEILGISSPSADTNTAENQPAGKYMLQLGDLSSVTVHVFPSVEEVRELSTRDLFGTRVVFAVPTNFSFTAIGGQAGTIRSISCTADGSQFAVAVTGKGGCNIIDSTNGKLAMGIRATNEPVLSCALSRDSKFILTTSSDCTACMWDLNNGKRLREIPLQFQANLCAVGDDSDVVATTSTENLITVWDAKTCDQVVVFQNHQAAIFCLTFSRKRQLLASGGTNGELFVWHYPTGEVKFHFLKHKSPVLAASFSQDGRRLCSVDRDALKVWDLFTGALVFTRDARGNTFMGDHQSESKQSEENSIRYTSCAFAAANLVVATTTSKQILLLDPNRGSELLSLPVKGVITAMGLNWNLDVIIFGDLLGNQYRLQLFFGSKDVQTFNLTSKPISKEKSKFD